MVLGVLDSILLFALSIPVVMQYRILPVHGTPYWLFGLLFLILVTHCFISFYPEVTGRFRKSLDSVKFLFLTVTIVIVLGGTVVTAMADRAKTAPVHGVHDIILQQEAAMRFLLTGKNPYKETYFGTPLESWQYSELGRNAVNPALYHFVMPPWYLLFPFVFYVTSIPVFGFFDGRMALLFAMVMLLLLLSHWYRDRAIARIAIACTALSPSVVNYFVEGRSDVFALSWLVGSLVLLEKKQYIWSGVLLALGVLSKQTIWFILPFFAVYVWKQKWKIAFGLVPIVVAITIPFLLWDTRAFLDSVVFYLSGNIAQSYPISGYGLGMMLRDFGIIRDIHEYYPFIYWQIAFALPVLYWLLRWLHHKPTQSKLLLSYAVFLSVFWYMSRYFNNSHVGYLSMLFVLGGLKAVDEKST